MPRRSPRPKPVTDDTPLPDGWVRHDGGPCPVPGESRPAVMFRSGTRFRPGERTAMSWAKMWEHLGHSMDIMAYREEDA